MHTLKKQIIGYYNKLSSKYSSARVNQIIFGGLLAISLTGGFFGYRFYAMQREAKAFEALDAVIDSFERVQYEMLNKEKFKNKETVGNAWDDVELLLDSLYKEHSSSYLAPFFLIYKSVIVFEKEKDVDKAREYLQEALYGLPKDSAIYEIFKFKKIQMSLDSKDEAIAKAALQEFIAMAQDIKGYCFEEAAYNLGLYYISQGDREQARQVWQTIVDNADKKGLLQSPWVKLVEEKLSSLA